ncbi:MAG: hypothetical protein EBE86_010730 [Hormoscilla sp. GUM202]|nr:hypothetical protein [Hormoscilla sp. GUM202]
MTVVSNTTPFSELAKVGQIDLLRRLPHALVLKDEPWDRHRRRIFGQVIIPQEVYDELTTGTHPEDRR